MKCVESKKQALLYVNRGVGASNTFTGTVAISVQLSALVTISVTLKSPAVPNKCGGFTKELVGPLSSKLHKTDAIEEDV